jgi:hypothetical protein
MIGTAGGVETGTLGDPSTHDALISGVHRTQGQTGMTPICPDPSGDAEPFRRLELLPTHTWQLATEYQRLVWWWSWLATALVGC